MDIQLELCAMLLSEQRAHFHFQAHIYKLVVRVAFVYQYLYMQATPTS